MTCLVGGNQQASIYQYIEIFEREIREEESSGYLSLAPFSVTERAE